MKEVDWKDVGIRCLKTFFEVLLGYLVTAFSGVIEIGETIDKKVLIGAIVCGVSTAFTAVLNGVIIPIFKGKENEDGLSGNVE